MIAACGAWERAEAAEHERAAQQRYRPAACSNAAEFQAAYDCPTPYVEMQPPPEGDAVFSRVCQARARQRPGGVRRCRNDQMDAARGPRLRPSLNI